MKLGKILITFLLLTLVLLLNGELYHAYVSDFSEDSFIIVSDIEVGKYESEFEQGCKILEEQGLKYYLLDITSVSDEETEINIYCNDAVKDFLINQRNHFEGRYKSFFLGTQTVRYHDIYDFTKRTLVSPSVEIYFINFNESQLSDDFLKSSGLDKIRNYYSGNDKILKAVCVLSWAIAFAVLLILSAFDAHHNKKEWMVRLCYGYPPNYLLYSKILIEIGSCAAIFIAECIFLHSYIEIRFLGKYIIFMAGVFFVLDIFIYWRAFYRMNYKIALQRAFTSNGLLSLSYTVKIALFALSMLCLMKCVFQMSSFFHMLSQREFYDNFKNYSHPQFSFVGYTEDPDEAARFVMEDSIYADKFSDWRITQWQSRSVNIGNIKTDAIYANLNAAKLLSEAVPSIDVSSLDKNVHYIFVPENLYKPDDSEFSRELRMFGDFLGDIIEQRIIPYTGDTEFYAFSGSALNGENDIEMMHNPIIYYNTEESFSEERIREYGMLCDYVMEACMVSDEQMKEYVLSNDFLQDYTLVNIYDAYNNRLQNEIKWLLLYGFIGILILALDVSVLKLIIKMEQEMNALEIAVKKVTGSPLVVRYRDIFVSEIKAVLIGFIASIALILILKESFSVWLVFIGLLLGLIDIGVLCFESRKWERISLHKIIKGGAL